MRRNQLIDEAVTGGIRVAAADLGTLAATSADLAGGRFLDAATETLPTVVLGDDAASRLGISPDDLTSNPRVWLGGSGSPSIGILEPVPLAPDLDSAALIGYPVAEELFDTTQVAVDAVRPYEPDEVEAVRAVLARSVDPQIPRRGRGVAAIRCPRGAGRPPMRRCATCSSGSAPWRSSSAASGSPT